jgi:hypothetical protein
MKMTDLDVRGVSGGSISELVEPVGGEASEGITRYVQGPWGLKAEASVEAQVPAPQPGSGSVADPTWAGCMVCMLHSDPGAHQAWAACKGRTVQPNSGAVQARADCRECRPSPVGTVGSAG